MNPSLKRLRQITSQKTNLIIGLMSGTSIDGLDVALCRITGSGKDTDVELLEFATADYPEEYTERFRKLVSVETCSLQELCLMNSQLGTFTGEAVLEMLGRWGKKPASIDCIASHGQTIYHAPKTKHKKKGFPNATLQVGDGDHIARLTGILTISDFRQKHTAAGGEGAPLVAPVDELLFRGHSKHRLLLNIGGIANFTYLPPAGRDLQSLTTDTGPGNTLMDKAARRILGEPFDRGGAAAAKGSVNTSLLKALKNNPYFALEMPKSTGPELFNWTYVQRALGQSDNKDILGKDLLATLSQFSADTVAESIRMIHKGSAPLDIFVSGGGLHNVNLMNRLKGQLPGARVSSFEEIGFNPDAKEAVCFAVLANETLQGEGFDLCLGGQREKVNFGKISLPN